MKRHETERHARNILSGMLRIEHQQRLHLRPRDQITRLGTNVRAPEPSPKPAQVVNLWLRRAYWLLIDVAVLEVAYQIGRRIFG